MTELEGLEGTSRDRWAQSLCQSRFLREKLELELEKTWGWCEGRLQERSGAGRKRSKSRVTSKKCEPASQATVMPGSSITLRSRGGRNDIFRKRKSQRWEGQELEQEAQGSDCPVSLGRHESKVCAMRTPLKTLVTAEVGSRGQEHQVPCGCPPGWHGENLF